MFGLESHKKKKKVEEFVFDLENDVKAPGGRATLKRTMETRIQEVKNVLRSGENKEEFQQLGQLLHGYTSLLRVISRIK